jgi:hypothetical protein
MLFDRRAAPGDLVVEARCGQDLVRSQNVLADDPAALPHADRRARREEGRPFVARHAVPQEAEVLVRLAAAFALGRRQLVRIGRVDLPDTRHQRHHHAVVGRPVHRALDPRQLVAARVAGLAHQRPEPLLRQLLRACDVDVPDAEHGREALHVVPRRLVRGAGQRADIAIAGGIDDDARPQPAHAALRRDVDLGHSAVVDLHAEDERVQQRSRARLEDELVPDTLQRLGVVRDAGARAVGVRALERHAAFGQTADHVVGDPGHDLPRRRAGGVEGIESVEHGGRSAAEEAETVDEQRCRAGSRGGDRRGAASGAGADDQHVDVVAHLCKSMHH